MTKNPDHRNATASWSGYLHQGKVGIFVALRKINELIGEERDSGKIKKLLENWEIIYENAEDFDIRQIKRGEDGNEIIKVESRHQVKANKGGRNLNDYKKVLLPKIEGVSNDSVFDISNVPEDKRFLHTIIDVQGRDSDGSIMNKIKYQEAKGKGEIINNPSWIDNPQDVRFFRYEANKFHCNIPDSNDEIDEYCIKEIEIYLKNINHLDKDNNEKHKNTLNNLLANLDNEIRTKHKTSDYPIYSFLDIENVIKTGGNFAKQQIHSLREVFSRAYEKYLNQLIDSNIDFSTTHLGELIDIMYRKNDDDFFEFLKEVNPDEKIEKKLSEISVEEILELFSIKAIKDIFFKALIFIEKNKLDIKNINYKKNNKKYFLSIISRDGMLKESIIKNIILNNAVFKVFENDYLINGQINDEEISSFRGFIDRNSEDEDEYKKYKLSRFETENDRFLNPELKFISVEKAIKKLDE